MPYRGTSERSLSSTLIAVGDTSRVTFCHVLVIKGDLCNTLAHASRNLGRSVEHTKAVDAGWVTLV